jgi:hypothetical protein
MTAARTQIVKRLPAPWKALGRSVVLAAGLLVCSTTAYAQVAIDSEFSSEPTWKIPPAAEVRSEMFKWLDEQKSDTVVHAKAIALWPEQATAEATEADAFPLLERVVRTMAVVDPGAQEIVDFSSQSHAATKMPEFSALTNEKAAAFSRNNLRLWLGQWLVQQRRYDEALEQLKDLQPADAVDPAALLFYQSVCHHWMLNKDDGLKTIAKLLEQRKSIPRRYQEVAELMQADLTNLQDESLDHISRRMNDVTRRLDFGHAGKKVRNEEDGIVASLDKLIKELEDMAQGMGSGSGKGDDDQPGGPGSQGNPQGIRSQSPAADSRLAQGKGPGEVKSKNIGNHSGWGDLPPKDRDEAMQQISKDFPSHYRDVIEQYFRRLATEDEEKK